MDPFFVAFAAGFALLAAAAFAVMAALIVWAGFFRTFFLVLPYVLVLALFNQNTGGLADASPPIYSRGQGTLFFPWFIWALWLLAVVALLRDKLLHTPTARCSLRPWIVALVLLFLAHCGIGLALSIPARESLSGYGLIHVANMGVLALLMLRTVDSRKALDLFIGAALVVIAARDVFGIVRFLFFGGDPANPYDYSSYAPGAKLTFFDINDSLLAGIAAAYCGFRLLHDYDSLRTAQKWFFAGVIALALATIMFSLRRTAWGGLALASALIVLLAPGRKRLAVGIPIAGVLAMGLAILLFKRLGVAWERAQVGWSALYYDMVGGSHYGQASLRALELQLGWEAYLESPLFGQGPWGRFAAYSGFGESWHGGEGAFGYVHSGVIHLLFKSGLVGFTLFCGLVGSFFLYVKRIYPSLAPRYRAVAVMGTAGMLFMMPDIFFGTPFIQIRTTLLIGLCLALPYVACNVARKAA